MILDETTNGIPYKEGLAGPKGMSFLLFPSAEHTKEMIAAAKAELRRTRDAVSIGIADDDEQDEEYRKELYSNPAAKSLKWYEIEPDKKLLRKERKKGTTPAQFVERFVLPNVEQKKAKHFAKMNNL